MDQNTKFPVVRERGAEWTCSSKATVYMSFNPDFTKKDNVGHLRAITDIHAYLDVGHKVDPAYMWCDYCVQRRTKNH